MKKLIPFILFIACIGFAKAQTPLANGAVISLFNGKNLVGWHQLANDYGTDLTLFTVERGAIRTYAKQAANSTQSFGALITDQAYENYLLTLEYKWGEKKFQPRANDVRDAGILIHIFGKEEVWPGGVECQIQQGDTGDLWLVKARATVKEETTHHNYDAKGTLKTIGSEDTYNRFPRSFCWENYGWNIVQVLVKGDLAQFYVNGVLVNEATDMKTYDETQKAWVPLTKGKILLQAEGSEVFYKNITLQNLD